MHRVWTRWIAQHLELKGGNGLREGIWVGMDESMSAMAKKNVPEPADSDATSDAPAIKGIHALDVTHAPLKPHLSKSLALLDSSNPPHKCTLCTSPLPASGASTLICPSATCNSTTHLTCLATHFLATERAERSDDKASSTSLSKTNALNADSLLPTSGSCPSCSTPLAWRDLVLELSLRMRGQKETAALFKAPRKRKADATAVAAEIESEEEPLEHDSEELEDLEAEEEEADIWHQLSSSPVAADVRVDVEHAPSSTSKSKNAAAHREAPKVGSSSAVTGSEAAQTKTTKTKKAQPAPAVIEIEDSDLNDEEILA